MANNEHVPLSPEHHINPETLRDDAEKAHERLRDQHESNAERAESQNKHEAMHDVEQAFARHEKESAHHEQVQKSIEKTPTHRINRTTKKENFDRTMSEIRPQMKPASRAFSSVIHNPVVENVSGVVGSTIARPNAILAGAVFAFVLTLAVYLIGHYFGYPLSGFESIGSFILGWVIGIVYDFLRVMITGKKA